jgi:hypothetical protein
LGSNCIHIETLQTIITEIEATLNNKPITYVSLDLNEPEPLTPSHLLCDRRLTCLPYPQKDIKNIYDTEPYTHVKLLAIDITVIKTHFSLPYKETIYRF